MHGSTGGDWKRTTTGVTAPVPDPTNLVSVGRQVLVSPTELPSLSGRARLGRPAFNGRPRNWGDGDEGAISGVRRGARPTARLPRRDRPGPLRVARGAAGVPRVPVRRQQPGLRL